MAHVIGLLNRYIDDIVKTFTVFTIRCRSILTLVSLPYSLEWSVVASPVRGSCVAVSRPCRFSKFTPNRASSKYERQSTKKFGFILILSVTL